VMEEKQLLKANEKLGREQFFESLHCSTNAALLLDYDGTLAPFRLERGQAFPYHGVTPLINQIISNGRTRVVMVTGRDANDIVPLLGVAPHPEIWGSQGLQRLRPDGTCEMPQLDESVQQALTEAEEWLHRQDLFGTAETKPGGIAVHWRGLPPEATADIRRRVLLGWLPLTERFPVVVLPFDGGLEIRSPCRNKGDAVRTILAEMGDRAPVAYLGDDQMDEDAFRALQDRGLTVLVRDEWRETSADLWIRPPKELVGFLSQWLKACGGI
jgi:trehalose 6-phosphate phosphatase